MTRRRIRSDRELHRKLGKELFNRTWDLLSQKRRTSEEDDEMLYAAHASRYHWGVVARPLQRSIGEWQLSRVYAVLGRPEPARHHAQKALDLARRHDLAPFYVAYGHEALARAASISGNRSIRNSEVRKASGLAKQIRSRDDRRMLEEDLATIP